MLNLIKEQNDIDKIYLYAKDLRKPKYEFLIKKRENAVIKHLNDPNAFIECWNTTNDVYENIDDYNPSRKRKILIVFEHAKFEYSPFGKIFNKELDKDDQKERLFKRLKNIESKIKSKDKKQSEPIKNEEQSEATKEESTIAHKKHGKIVLLKDRLDYIFKNFGSHFNSTRKYFLKKLAKDEKKIDYDNFFFNIDEKPVVKSVDFLEEVSTLYDLLIYLLANADRVLNSAQTQINFFKVINVLKTTISSMKTDITDQSEEQKKKIFAEQESVLKNAKLLLEKRGEIINQFTKNNIISRGWEIFWRT